MLCTDDISVKCPDTTKAAAQGHVASEQMPSAKSLQAGILVSRQESGIQSSPMIELRNSVNTLGDEFPRCVLEAALRALQDGNFSKTITEHPIVPQAANNKAASYLLLLSIAEHMKANGININYSSHNIRERLKSTGLESGAIDDLIKGVTNILPATVMARQRTIEDELY